MATTAELQAYATTVAQKYSIPTSVFLAQINQESGWNPNAVNASSGATGLAQALPSTAANPGYGVAPLTNLTDPYQSLDFAGAYDAALYKQTGSWDSALSRYSGGAYTADSLVGSSVYGTNAGTTAASSSVAGSTGSGVGAAVSGFTTSLLSPVWEIVSRGLLIWVGILLIIAALFALLWQSKTVQTTAKTVGKVAAVAAL